MKRLAVAVLVASVCVIALGQSRSSAETFHRTGADLTSASTRPLFGDRPLAPGEARSRCVVIPADRAARDVRLFTRTRGTGLDPFVYLTIVRGSLAEPGPSGSCSGLLSQLSHSSRTWVRQDPDMPQPCVE